MSRETPLEVAQVRDYLHREFELFIIGKGKTREEQARNFRSKSLAALALHALTGCGHEEASKAIVDGGGDGGIDALYFHAHAETLWVVQSKFFNDGHGEPALGDVAKFKEGLENLLSNNFGAFETNEAFKLRIPSLQTLFSLTGLKVRSVLVYSGLQIGAAEERIRMFEKVRERYSSDSDYFASSVYNLTSVHGWLLPGEHNLGVDVTLTLHHPARVSQPHEMHYGLVSLAELNDLYTKYDKQLVTANIREYKGTTEVNTSILGTLQDSPQHFLYLNNGLTAYCSRMDVVAADRGNAAQKRISVKGFAIVNGAQTLGSIARFAKESNQAPEGFVFLKLVSLARLEDDQAFAKQMTRSTNFQNQVGLRDFAALDDEQRRIAEQLELSNIHYHYKQSADTAAIDEENFDFEEALVALACLEPPILPTPASSNFEQDFLCARVLSNRDALRSDEPVYTESEQPRSRYRRLFRTDRSARTVWRSVQTKRAVEEIMRNNTKAERGNPRRKAFFTNARWLVLHLIFLRLHPERGEVLELSNTELQAVSNATNIIAETLWERFEKTSSSAHPKTIFSSTADCLRLKNEVMTKLAST
jgi:AIPR protein